MKKSDDQRSEWRALRKHEEKRRGSLDEIKGEVRKKENKSPKSLLKYLIHHPETRLSDAAKDLKVEKKTVRSWIKYLSEKNYITVDDPLSTNPNISAGPKLTEFVKKKAMSKKKHNSTITVEEFSKEKPTDLRVIGERMEESKKRPSKIEKQLPDDTGYKDMLEEVRDQLMTEKGERIKAEEQLKRIEREAGGLIEESKHIEELLVKETQELRRRQEDLKKLITVKDESSPSDSEHGLDEDTDETQNEREITKDKPQSTIEDEDDSASESGDSTSENKSESEPKVTEETEDSTVASSEPTGDADSSPASPDKDDMISSFLEEASKPPQLKIQKETKVVEVPEPVQTLDQPQARHKEETSVGASRLDFEKEKMRIEEIRKKEQLEADERKSIESDRLKHDLKKQAARKEKSRNDLLKIIAESGSIRLNNAAKELRVDKKKVEVWMNKLADQDVITVQKHMLGGPEMRLSKGAAKKVKTKKEEEDIEQIKNELKRLRDGG